MPWWNWESVRRRTLPRGVKPAPDAPPELVRRANAAPPPGAGPGPHHPLLPLLAALASLVATAKENETEPTGTSLHEQRLEALRNGDARRLLEVEKHIEQSDRRWKAIGDERRAAAKTVALWLDAQLESFGAPPRHRRWSLIEIGGQVQYHVNDIGGE